MARRLRRSLAVPVVAAGVAVSALGFLIGAARRQGRFRESGPSRAHVRDHARGGGASALARPEVPGRRVTYGETGGPDLPLRGWSVVDCLDAKPLELFKVVSHGLERFRRVPLPVQDLFNDSKRVLGSVAPCRIAGGTSCPSGWGHLRKGPVGSTR